MEYLLTFLEGFASFISPCILPLVPVYISYFMGSQAENKISKTLINSIFFVLGSSIIFILLAVLASTFGILVAENIKIIKTTFAILLIFLGLDYIGIIRIKWPIISSKLSFDTRDLNILKSFVFGIFFSISHTPCTGAFLASAILLIVKEQNLAKGVFLMSLYALGLGLPFIISALIIEKMKTIFNFIKKHYLVFKIISGVILIVTGLYLLF